MIEKWWFDKLKKEEKVKIENLYKENYILSDEIVEKWNFDWKIFNYLKTIILDINELNRIKNVVSWE